ncbi:MAG: hypothetical protein JW842_12270 [Prolixibacteraceae bacterium]|nr:hypothetical protein [Prolixibacteraceae bacterium]
MTKPGFVPGFILIDTIYMQVRIYLPFVDMRHLQDSLSGFVAEPNRIHNSGNLFKRCGGKMLADKTYDWRNALTINSEVVKNISKKEIKLKYLFGNETVGVFNIVVNIPESKTTKQPANDLAKYLNKNIELKLRMLFEPPHVRKRKDIKGNTMVKSSLFTIRNEMPRYYYLSTIRFKEKMNNDKGKTIIDPNPEISIENIIFLDPIITIENAHKSASIKGKNYYYIPDQLHVASCLLKNGNHLYHFRRERSIFGKRHKLKQINKSIDNFVKCSFSLNACICLLKYYKSNFNQEKVARTLVSALDTCLDLKDSLYYYKKNFNGGEDLNEIADLIAKMSFKENKLELGSKLKQLKIAKASERLIL